MSKVSNEEFQIRKEENKKQISNTILQVKNLSAGYEDEQVIKDISFTLSKLRLVADATCFFHFPCCIFRKRRYIKLYIKFISLNLYQDYN